MSRPGAMIRPARASLDVVNTLPLLVQTAERAKVAYRLLLGVFCVALAVVSVSAQPVWHVPGTAAAGTPVGSLSTVQHIPFTVSGTISNVRVLTGGSANLDFADAGTGTCAVSTSPTTCFVDVIFTPTAPGRRTGAVVLIGSGNQVLGSQLLDGVALGPLSVLRSGRIDTVVGDGDSFYRSDGIPATSAPIYIPKGVVTDAAGNLFLSDTGNNRIRRVGAVGGILTGQSVITTIAGDGSPGGSGDGGPATSARVSGPSGLVIDGAGNLYIADSGNHAVRRIDAVTGVITTVAGTLQTPGYTGDGGAATSATLTAPNAVALDKDNNLYIADRGNNVIRRVDANTQTITTFAGTTRGYYGDGGLATAARLDTPLAVAFGPDGSLYLAELGNNVIRRIDTAGVISTVAGDGAGGFGGDDGAATSAKLSGPDAIVVDPAGNLYLADGSNNRIRRVDALTSIITTIAGENSTAAEGDGYNANTAGLSGPYALFLDSGANLFVADQFHNRIRRILSNNAVLLYPVMKVGKTSASQSIVIENDGNTDLTPGSNVFADSALDSTITTCTATPLHAGDNCVFGIEFAPTQTGAPRRGTFTFNSDGTNAPDVVNLSGNVLPVEPTTVDLSGTPNPVGVAQTVVFTAKVSSLAPARSGTVTFYDGAQPLGTANLGGDSASLSIATLTLGQHTIVATYSGDDANAASDSASLVEKVLQPTRIILSSSPNPSTVTQTVVLTAAITANNTAISSGILTFFDSGTKLGSSPIDGNGSSTFSTNQLTTGPHSIYATFDGDAVSAPSQSNTVSQVVDHASSSTLLSASPGTITLGDNVTLTAIVNVPSGPAPTGTVTFRSDALVQPLGSGTLTNGTATLTSNALPVGTNHLTATYSGDTFDAGSTSSPITETVNRVPTVTSLASSANPANAGSPLQLTATVTLSPGQQSVGPISGPVMFYDGANPLGSTSLLLNGTAVFSTSGLLPGSHVLTAVCGGNTSYGISTSPGLTQTVQQLQSTTTLALSASNIVAAKPLTLTVSVATAGVKASGRVNFFEGPNLIGRATLSPQATTSITLTTLPVGTHTITATYGGDVNYTTSTSPAASVTVRIGNTSLSLATSATQITVGNGLTLSGTLTGDGVLPAGASITLQDNGSVFATLSSNTSGIVTFTTSSLTVGSHTLIAAYAGDANNAAAQSQPRTVVVQQAKTGTTLTSNQTPSVVSTALTLHAIVTSTVASPGGSIQFQDGTVLLGTIPVSPTGDASFTLSTLSVGAHTLSAVYSGDINHAGSSSAPLTQQVVQPTSLSLQTSKNPSIASLPVDLTARLILTGTGGGSSSVLPTGTITFLDGTSVLSKGTLSTNALSTNALSFHTTSLAVGTHNITANYAGDSNFEPSTSTVLVQVVNNASTNAVLNVSSSNLAYGGNLSLTALLTGTGSAITGPVVFFDGTTSIGQAVLDANGTASIDTTALSPDIHSLVASYAGDANNAKSVSSAVRVQVRQSGQIIVVSSSNPSLTLDQLTLTASIVNAVAPAASGAVQFQEGGTLLGIATLDVRGMATLRVGPLVAGTHTFTASYPGDDRDYPLTSSALPVQVQLRPTSNALTATAPSAASGGILSLISVVQWSGPVAPTGVTTFRANGNVLGTSRLDAAGITTLDITSQTLPATVTASYSGDAAYAASDSAAVKFPNTDATNFTIHFDPTTLSLQSGKFVAGKLTMHSLLGFSDTLALGCLGLPYAATCTFDKDQVQLAPDGTISVNVTIDTGSPLTSGSQASMHPQQRSKLALCFFPTGALCAFLLLRSRTKLKVPALAVVVLLMLLAPLSGCGTLKINSTPPGTYMFQISASGQQTGVTLSQPVPLTVKP